MLQFDGNLISGIFKSIGLSLGGIVPVVIVMVVIAMVIVLVGIAIIIVVIAIVIAIVVELKRADIVTSIRGREANPKPLPGWTA